MARHSTDSDDSRNEEEESTLKEGEFWIPYFYIYKRGNKEYLDMLTSSSTAKKVQSQRRGYYRKLMTSIKKAIGKTSTDRDTLLLLLHRLHDLRTLLFIDDERTISPQRRSEYFGSPDESTKFLDDMGKSIQQQITRIHKYNTKAKFGKLPDYIEYEPVKAKRCMKGVTPEQVENSLVDTESIPQEPRSKGISGFIEKSLFRLHLLGEGKPVKINQLANRKAFIKFFTQTTTAINEAFSGSSRDRKTIESLFVTLRALTSLLQPNDEANVTENEINAYFGAVGQRTTKQTVQFTRTAIDSKIASEIPQMQQLYDKWLANPTTRDTGDSAPSGYDYADLIVAKLGQRLGNPRLNMDEVDARTLYEEINNQGLLNTTAAIIARSILAESRSDHLSNIDAALKIRSIGLEEAEILRLLHHKNQAEIKAFTLQDEAGIEFLKEIDSVEVETPNYNQATGDQMMYLPPELREQQQDTSIYDTAQHLYDKGLTPTIRNELDFDIFDLDESDFVEVTYQPYQQKRTTLRLPVLNDVMYDRNELITRLFGSYFLDVDDERKSRIDRLYDDMRMTLQSQNNPHTRPHIPLYYEELWNPEMSAFAESRDFTLDDIVINDGGSFSSRNYIIDDSLDTYDRQVMVGETDYGKGYIMQTITHDLNPSLEKIPEIRNKFDPAYYFLLSLQVKSTKTQQDTSYLWFIEPLRKYLHVGRFSTNSDPIVYDASRNMLLKVPFESDKTQFISDSPQEFLTKDGFIQALAIPLIDKVRDIIKDASENIAVFKVMQMQFKTINIFRRRLPRGSTGLNPLFVSLLHTSRAFGIDTDDYELPHILKRWFTIAANVTRSSDLKKITSGLTSLRDFMGSQMSGPPIPVDPNTGLPPAFIPGSVIPPPAPPVTVQLFKGLNAAESAVKQATDPNTDKTGYMIPWKMWVNLLDMITRTVAEITQTGGYTEITNAVPTVRTQFDDLVANLSALKESISGLTDKNTAPPLENINNTVISFIKMVAQQIIASGVWLPAEAQMRVTTLLAPLAALVRPNLDSIVPPGGANPTDQPVDGVTPAEAVREKMKKDTEEAKNESIPPGETKDPLDEKVKPPLINEVATTVTEEGVYKKKSLNKIIRSLSEPKFIKSLLMKFMSKVQSVMHNHPFVNEQYYNALSLRLIAVHNRIVPYLISLKQTHLNMDKLTVGDDLDIGFVITCIKEIQDSALIIPFPELRQSYEMLVVRKFVKRIAQVFNLISYNPIDNPDITAYGIIKTKQNPIEKYEGYKSIFNNGIGAWNDYTLSQVPQQLYNALNMLSHL